MRRLLVGLVVAAATVLVPMWALAGNQEVAEEIAANLRKSGQLHGYKIGVKFQDGTAWLRGEVTNPEQMNAALSLVFQTPGVTRVVNNLTIAEQESATPAAGETAKPKPASALDRVQAALTERLNTIQSAGSSLKQSAGAVAAEQLPRVAPDRNESRDQQASQSVERIERSADSPFPARIAQTSTPHAQRVPTTFSQEGVQPTAATATQKPTLALPKQALQTGMQNSKPIPVAMTQPLAPAAPVDAVPGVPVGPVPAAPVGPVPGAVVEGMPVPGVPIEGMPIQGMPYQGAPLPAYGAPVPAAAMPPASYDQPHLPAYAWPGYAAYPNYAALTYPKQHSPTAWPYIGPFYPYPQVPLGWRKVTLEWHDGWWALDFDDCSSPGWFSGLFRHH